MTRVRMTSRRLALMCICTCFCMNFVGYIYYRFHPLLFHSEFSRSGSSIVRPLEVKDDLLTKVKDNVRNNITAISSLAESIRTKLHSFSDKDQHAADTISKFPSLAGLVRQSERQVTMPNPAKLSTKFTSLGHVDFEALRRHALGVINSNMTFTKHPRLLAATRHVPGPTFSSTNLQPKNDALSDVFHDFSISFRDLNAAGKKFFPNPVHFKKFVMTPRSSTEMSTVKINIPLANLSTIEHVTPTSRTPELINPHPFNYTLLEGNICPRNTSIKMFTVIVVCSGVGNFIARKAIRETWGSRENLLYWRVGLVFMVGSTYNQTVQSRVQNESSMYRDIVQENFIDSYRNLSLKSVAILKWVSRYCEHVKFMLKTDDDMFINVQNLQVVLERTPPKGVIIGAVIVGAGPIQNNKSKWYTPEKDFPDKHYPKYCSGTAYAISLDVVRKLYDVTLHTTLFWLEDIYITGICAKKVHPRHVNNRAFTYATREVSGCAFRNAISGHRVSSVDMHKIWKELTNQKLTCPTKAPLKKPRPVVASRNKNIPLKRMVRPRPPRNMYPRRT